MTSTTSIQEMRKYFYFSKSTYLTVSLCLSLVLSTSYTSQELSLGRREHRLYRNACPQNLPTRHRKTGERQRSSFIRSTVPIAGGFVVCFTCHRGYCLSPQKEIREVCASKLFVSFAGGAISLGRRFSVDEHPKIRCKLYGCELVSLTRLHLRTRPTDS